MSLIEQLGGYEETKKHLDSCWCDDDNRAYLLEKLLEHRRQHNIFEPDDYIIHDDELKVFCNVVQCGGRLRVHRICVCGKWGNGS